MENVYHRLLFCLLGRAKEALPGGFLESTRDAPRERGGTRQLTSLLDLHIDHMQVQECLGKKIWDPAEHLVSAMAAVAGLHGTLAVVCWAQPADEMPFSVSIGLRGYRIDARGSLSHVSRYLNRRPKTTNNCDSQVASFMLHSDNVESDDFHECFGQRYMKWSSTLLGYI